MQGLAYFVWIPMVILAITALPFLARLILGPISQAAGILPTPTRFQLSDFAWLLVKLQAAFAVCVQFVGLESRGSFGVVLAFLVFAVTALWIGAISFLTRAGISSPPRRAVFVLLVLPATLAFLIGFPATCMVAAVRVIDYSDSVRIGQLQPSWVDYGLAAGAFLAGAVAFGLVAWSLRRLSVWVAASGQLDLRRAAMPPVMDQPSER